MHVKKLLNTALIVTTGLLFNSNAVLAEEAPYPAQMTVNVYQAPTTALALDKAYLLYEMYVTSFMTMPVTLNSLKVKDGNNIIYTNDYNEKEFEFKPHESKIIYLTIPFDKLTDVPNSLSNQFIFSGKFENKKTNFPLVPPVLTINKMPPVIISTPLRGSNWLAGSGLSNTSSHRRAALYFDGRPYNPELYAIDFVQMGSNGRTFEGDINKNSSYYCYNQDILAVAEGTVVQMQDGIPENVPHSGNYAVTMNEKTLPGNYIIMDLGNNKFAAYAHLIPGSIKVKQGDYVKRGEVIAKLGNSGNSGEPHLHLQVTDKGVFLSANGIPYGFDHFKVIPSKMTNVEEDTIFKMEFLKGNSKEFTNQLPLENTLMSFE